MATHEKRGWAWNDVERAWIRTWQRRVQKMVQRIEADLVIVRRTLPEYAKQAERAASDYLEHGTLLLKLDGRKRGRKFQPISPEKALQLLNSLRDDVVIWRTFVQKRDVVAAAKQRSQEAETAAKRRHQESTETLASPEYRDGLASLLVESLSMAGLLTTSSDGAPQYSSEAMEQIFAAAYVDVCCDEARRHKLQDLFDGEPCPSRLQLMVEASVLLLQDVLAGNVKSMGMSPLDSKLALALNRQRALASEWAHEGLTEQDVSERYKVLIGWPI